MVAVVDVVGGELGDCGVVGLFGSDGGARENAGGFLDGDVARGVYAGDMASPGDGKGPGHLFEKQCGEDVQAGLRVGSECVWSGVFWIVVLAVATMAALEAGMNQARPLRRRRIHSVARRPMMARRSHALSHMGWRRIST